MAYKVNCVDALDVNEIMKMSCACVECFTHQRIARRRSAGTRRKNVIIVL